MAGISGPLLLLDGLNAFIIFPFRNFFLRLRTVWFTLTHTSKRERARPGTVILTAGALLAALLLFTASAGLLISADAGFAALMSGFESLFRFRLDDDALFTLLISLPIGAYLFGLIAGSAGRMKPAFAGGVKPFIRAWPCCAGCPNSLWVGIAGLFCLLYLAFFLVQARYLFGAFTRTLPDGFIVSQYARQGFFELCQVMAVNFLLLWLVTRLSAKPVNESAVLKLLCALLLAESLLFAAIAFSKLALYISCFGFTPRRLQSSWLVCVLAAGCVSALYSLLSGKSPSASGFCFRLSALLFYICIEFESGAEYNALKRGCSMKIAIVYKSLTGNTAMVAEALKEALKEKGPVYFGPPEGCPEAELYFVGSWTDKGSCAGEIGEFLRSLENKKAALFGTAGFGGSEEYFRVLSARAAENLGRGCTFLGSFYCQGKMPPSVRARYEALLRDNPGDKRAATSIENFDAALSHPDRADLEKAKSWALTMLAASAKKEG